MNDLLTEFRCGSPKHAERSGEPDWSDSTLAVIRGERIPQDNPFRCEACGRLLKEESNDADNL